ncbi:MAG: cytochrome c [Gemmatimonadota bacterium]
MNRWLKGIGYVVGGLLGLVLVTAAGIYGFSEARYRKQYTVTPRAVAVPTDSASVARGEHLVQTIAACVDCHGENLGGKVVFDAPAFGRVYALNLTRGKGGVGGTLTDADFVRAIRHGIAPTGRALKVMPSSDYMNLSDADLGAIIAYVKSRPPVDNEVPSVMIGPIGRALMVAGKLPILEAESIDHEKLQVASVTPAPTAGYGAYLASIGCKGCHGPTLAGGPILGGDPSWPPAANLTPSGSTKDWSEDDFRKLLREGKRPNGLTVNAAMPFRIFGKLTDEEIHAIFLYLRSIAPQATPGVVTASK